VNELGQPDDRWPREGEALRPYDAIGVSLNDFGFAVNQ
jgi:hypothetical protein